MRLTSEEELQGMKRAGAVVAEALAAMKALVAPGVTPRDLDALCGEVFARHGALSAPRLEYGAPVNAFVSVNADVVHGLPMRQKLRPGDVVKLDVTPNVDGFVADAAVTVVVPPVPRAAQRLVACAEAALAAALGSAHAGGRLADIGGAVERTVRRRGFFVLRELAGHGVGRTIHEAPEVLNFATPDRSTLTEGMVLAIEPMIAARRGRVVTRADGWTLGVHPASLTAHVEHTVVIRRGEPLVLTA